MQFPTEDIAGGRLTIDLGALTDNWLHLSRLANDAECAAVVKANAYGCEIEPVVKALSAKGCRTFFVALPDEGRRARAAAPDAEIFILNGLFENSASYLIEHKLNPVLGSLEEIELWAATAKNDSAALPCAVQMDSGMSRMGISAREAQRLVTQDHLMKFLDIKLFMTHYACADDIGHAKTEVQREIFKQTANLFPNARLSAANSAATLQASGHEFDLVRPGIALYGGEALNDVPNPMKPVVTLEGRINKIREAKKGDTVGYGASETLIRDTRIAYLSLGYADGYHRASSHMGVGMRFVSEPAKGAFNGHILNGIGRISMDLCAFDITDISENEIKQGDWIELFGNTIAIDDVARAAGTIGYELLTGLGNRYSRTYLNADG